MRRIGLGLLLGVICGAVCLEAAETVPAVKLIGRIRAVRNTGEGNQDAAAAWKELVAQGPEALVPILSAMNDDSLIARNWLRTAADAIVEAEVKSKRPLPAATLEAFVQDGKKSPVGRRMAYEFLAKQDLARAEGLLDGLLDDPDADLRRDAVARAIGKIAADAPDAAQQYQKLFPFTRDQDQAQKVAKELKNRGVKVSLLEHFNIIDQWMLVGPFDSPQGTAYNKPLPPEAGVDLGATYAGKRDQPVKWQVAWSFDNEGEVDLNQFLGKYKDAVAYAYVAVESESERPAEIRLGSAVSVELFVNGARVFAREEYHHGQRFDQYVAPITLKKGKNEVLVKLLQNNQLEPWAQAWTFQSFRICDATGGKIPLKQLTAQ